MWRDLGKSLLLFVTFVCISYFALQICIILPRTDSSSHKKKKGYKACIFLWNINVQMFDILNEHNGIHQFNC